ncbi:MAG: hypothetical protein AA931_07040 [Peptococcaceae bacterium 1109]|nr:MAG: hypothetical protein AA931_07040 [Peptococcaceae bacterium 1109]
MNLSSTAVRRPVAVTVCVIIALLFGIVSLQRIGIDLLPNMSLPYAVVVTTYAGASAEVVEHDVTIPLEAHLAGVSGVRRQDSYSMENFSVIMLEFEWGTDMLSALDDIRNNLAQAALSLPSEASSPVVARIDPNTLPLMLVAVSAQDLTELELSQQLAKIKPGIEQLPGVASVSLLGTTSEEIQVLYDAKQLSEAGLSPAILQQLIMYQNIIVPSGTVTEGDLRYSTRTGRRISSLDDLKDLIIGMKQGSGILGLGGLVPSLTYLSDLAEISIAATKPEGITRYNGEDTVIIKVMRQSGANTVRVAESVKKALRQIEESNPNLQFAVVSDQSAFITSSISNLMSSLVLGGILAVAVLWFFLRNLGSMVVIGLSIPISIITSFVLVYLSDLSLNLMTLGGLALGVGMLVDTSIVVLENIYRYRSLGFSPLEAAEKGTREITGAIIASTTTTVVVFLPVIFLESLAGQLLKELGLTVSYSLLASLVVGLTVLPTLAARLLRRETKSQKAQAEPSKLQRGYLRLLDAALKRKWLALGVVIAVVLLAVAIFPTIGEEFLPNFDEGFLNLTFTLPAGRTIDMVKEEVAAIEGAILAVPGVAGVSSQAGDQGDTDISSLITGTGNNVVVMSVRLEPANKRSRSSSEIANEVRQVLFDANVIRSVVVESSLFGTSASSILSPRLVIETRGDSMEPLKEVAEQIKAELHKIPGLLEIDDSWAQANEGLFLEVDTARSILGGFTAGQVGLGVHYATSGLKATDVTIDGRTLPVMLRPRQVFESVEDLLAAEVFSPVSIAGFGENPIVLGEVAEAKTELIPPTIQRTDRMYTLNISANLGDNDLSWVTAQAEKLIAGLGLPENVQVRIGGLQEVIDESLSELYFAVGLAVILVFLVMAAQFESFAQPLIIMVAIPLALIGSIFGLWITDNNIGIISMIGMIVLVGIVVNNTIVLVDFINQRRREGSTVRDAVREACVVRLRPILMTTITTVLGMVPLAMGWGEGAEFQRALAVTVIGGLTSSTILILFVVPIVYSLIQRDKPLQSNQ